MWPNIRESQYKDEGRKNNGGGTGKLNKQYTKRRRALKCVEEASDEEKKRLEQKYREKSRRMQQIRLLLEQDMINNRNGARGLKKMGENCSSSWPEIGTEIAYYSNTSNEEKRWNIGHWNKTSVSCMRRVLQESPEGECEMEFTTFCKERSGGEDNKGSRNNR